MCSDKTLPSCHLFQHKSQTDYCEPESKQPGKNIEGKQPDLLHSPLNISPRPNSSGAIGKLTQSNYSLSRKVHVVTFIL